MSLILIKIIVIMMGCFKSEYFWGESEGGSISMVTSLLTKNKKKFAEGQFPNMAIVCLV